MAEVVKVGLVRDFNKVIISLENMLLPDEKLSPTPSMCDGLNCDAEMDLRILGCELIQTSGNLLRLPQVAMATGQVLYQRFYYSKSFVKHSFEVVAMACVNLASKIEEAPRRIRDVINALHHIKQIRSKKPAQPLILDQNYVNLKNQVIKAERRVLKELGFCVHVKHPHKIIVMYLQVLEAERNRELVQHSWNYMNDSFRTNVFVRFPPETIACACIYLAARKLQIALPNNPAWYRLFGADESDIQQVCLAVLKLYSWHKPNLEELDKLVNTLKKANLEAKIKAKELCGVGATPTLASQAATPEKGMAPSPILRSDILRRLKSDDEKSTDSFGRDCPRNKKRRSRSRSNSRHKKTRSEHNSDKHSRSSSSRSPRPLANSKSDVRRNDTIILSDSKGNARSTDTSRQRLSDYRGDYERRDERRDGKRERGVDRRDDKHVDRNRLPSRYAVDTKKLSSSKHSPVSSDDRMRKKLSRRANHDLSPARGRSDSLSPDVQSNTSSKKHSSNNHKNNGHHRHGRSRSKERRSRNNADSYSR